VADINFEHVYKRFGLNAEVIHDLNLHIRDHEFLVLVGPSGCGKSTALRMIAGLEEISDGNLYIGRRLVNGVAPRDRDVAMVFQNYALYPHMNVFENMAFSLRLRHRPNAEITASVQKVAEMLSIGAYLRRKPRELSGGQRQRVALGRAIVRAPQVFLMDEPLSNLDAKLRVQMRADLARLHQQVPVTTVYVTHDQTEAMTMGNRIAVLNAGVIQQLGTPQELYEAPANLFVAGFIGSPSMDFFHGHLKRESDGGTALVIGNGGQARALPLPKETSLDGATDATENGRAVIVGIRPEHIHLETDMGNRATLDATVEVIEHLGNEQVIYIRTPGATVPQAAETQSSTVRLPATARVHVGDTVALALDVTKIHIFDPATTEKLA
jgi:multiple sugar transport system ATP-binding protein